MATAVMFCCLFCTPQPRDLPATAVDAKKSEARFEDGVFEVTLPKAKEAKPKQIEVKVN